MNFKAYLAQFVAALAIFSVLAICIKAPGYMDAEYYTLSAVQLASGKGLTQPILWNYLDDPSGLPHPSHTYWMPGPSLMAVSGMLLFGSLDFLSGRIPFVLMAAICVPLTGWMGFRLSGRKSISWLAAGLAILNGYYSPYTATVDSFFLIMTGAWVIYFSMDRVLNGVEESKSLAWLGLGLAAGWVHLNRADGLLWLAAVLLFWFAFAYRNKQLPKEGNLWIGLLLIILGYLAVCGFWYYRNITQFASLFPPGTSRALWVTRYDEIFTFPASKLTFERWVGSGLGVILIDRLTALMRNLLTIFAVQGQVILIPFVVTAIVKYWQIGIVRVALAFETIILLIMSFIFPYSGMQGGFLHSSAALQPVVWGLAAAGVPIVVHWLVLKKQWNVQRTFTMAVSGILLVSALITGFSFWQVVIGGDPGHPKWGNSQDRAQTAANLLDSAKVPQDARLMINNPAGFSLATGREALVIPYGDPSATISAAQKYGAEYVLLEKNLVRGMFDLYLEPNEFSDFSLVTRYEDMLLFKIEPSGKNQ